ncbi:hypothetical protein J6Q66_09585 [bacterium]|nr:hypothetical protein [bacterium]
MDMDIAKILKDYTKNTRDLLFEEFLDEQLGSLACREEIVNPEFVYEKSKPVNDFMIYSNDSLLVGARRLASRK